MKSSRFTVQEIGLWFAQVYFDQMCDLLLCIINICFLPFVYIHSALHLRADTPFEADSWVQILKQTQVYAIHCETDK